MLIRLRVPTRQYQLDTQHARSFLEEVEELILVLQITPISFIPLPTKSSVLSSQGYVI